MLRGRQRFVGTPVALGGLRLAVGLGVLWAATAPSRPVSEPPASAAVEASLAQQVAALEYRPSVHQGVLTAPNRAQGLRLRWMEDAVRVEDRVAGTHLATLSTEAVGRRGAWRQLGEAEVVDEAGRVVRRWEGLTEWWLNGPEGVEQGWTVAARPAGDGPLLLWVGVAAAHVEEGTDGLRLRAEGGRLLAYGRLAVTDARGRAIPARLRAEARGLAVEVDDADALYPLTVDPLLTADAWTAEIDQAAAGFGLAVAGAGDVNGDGYSDIVVGAPSFANGMPYEGGAFLYLGGPNGLAPTPAWTAEANQANALLGASVAGVGDVNGDGYSDVAVGSLSYSNGQADEGRVFVYLGSAQGLSTAAEPLEINQAGAAFGASVAGAGDVNGDGYSDVLVGAENFSNGETKEGGAFLFLGSASGLQSSPAWTAESGQFLGFLGRSVAAAGDVNGDGFSDVIVGAPQASTGQLAEGHAFVYLGSASGLSPAASWTAQADQPAALLGTSVAGAGDVNGDGYSDVIIGAFAFSNGQPGEGRAFLYLGSAQGLSLAADWSAESNQDSASFGSSVAGAGDVNGDGYSDVIVGTPAADDGELDEGQAALFLGSATGLAPVPAWTTHSDQGVARLGHSVAGAGDVNGDGFSDVVVGAPQFDNVEADEGRALVYLGTAGGPSLVAAWTGEPDRAGAALGASAAGAGDVNGDGFSDVIVGAAAWDNGEPGEGAAFLFLGSDSGLSATAAWTAEGERGGAFFAASVAGVGDVDGDGFADVVIGAPMLENGEASEGMAFLYRGGTAGLARTPAWAAEGDAVSANFGSSVAGAGDVNGDGYSDVIVGARYLSNGAATEGGAYLYQGGVAGLSRAPVWVVEGGSGNAQFGTSVAGAGDVNGDGYSDVVVGAATLSNGEGAEGRALLFLGGASGLASTPAWAAEADQVNAQFGFSVAGAGDVNGDGFSDVLVGAQLFDNGEPNEGRAFLYLGGVSGLAATPSWTAEANRSVSWFGCSVTGAGDVNGDGYDDVAVGAFLFDSGNLGGKAFLFLGGASGLSAAPAWVATADQVSAMFGVAVAGAQDVNGDGFDDLLVGASGYDDGQADEGRVFLYLGGDEAPGLARSLGQRFGGTAVGVGGHGPLPVKLEARAVNATSALFPRVRVEFEVRAVGVPFDGLSTSLSSPARAGTMAASGPIFAPGRYHWRARAVAGDSRGRWVSYGGNDESQADFVGVYGSSGDGGGVSDGGCTLCVVAPMPDVLTCGKPWQYEPIDPADAGVSGRWTAVNAPDNVRVDEATGVLEWTPTPAQRGPQSFGLVAKVSGAPTPEVFPVDVTVECPSRVDFDSRCGCAAGPGTLAWVAVLVVLRRRRR